MNQEFYLEIQGKIMLPSYFDHGHQVQHCWRAVLQGGSRTMFPLGSRTTHSLVGHCTVQSRTMRSLVQDNAQFSPGHCILQSRTLYTLVIKVTPAIEASIASRTVSAKNCKLLLYSRAPAGIIGNYCTVAYIPAYSSS